MILETSPFLHISRSLVSEAKIPSDRDSILGSFHADVDDRKFSPTVEFLKEAFWILNEKFFKNSITDRLQFLVKTQPRNNAVGSAAYIVDNRFGIVTPINITLNNAWTMTLHQWLEVVLHEMIHVLDYQTNPRNFTGYMGRYYDAHGKWFMDEGRKFEPEGFNVEKYCHVDMGINTDDRRIQSSIRNSVFVRMKGTDPRPLIIKMSRGSMRRQLTFLANRISRSSSTLSGVKEFEILTSENPEIINIKEMKMRDSYSKVSWYWWSDQFEAKYGPFKEEERISVESMRNPTIDEDKDEAEYDEYSHIDDEFARKMYDNISGVIDVKKIGDEKYEVSIG